MIMQDIETRRAVIEEMNFYGRSRLPFLFILDFDLDQPVIRSLTNTQAADFLFEINGRRNYASPRQGPAHAEVALRKFPVPYENYLEAFNKVQDHLRRGDSYLLNLTFPTRIETNVSLKDIFYNSRAPYKLYMPEKFVVFSPETFVRIEKGKMMSFPMKGTLNASASNAREKLLNDPKELAEHVTIVDLIRNDMSMLAERVQVENFRYIDEVKTHENTLLQVSSRISGQLGDDYPDRIGDIICAMLPAGSVTGAPKDKTVRLIREIEGYDRGFYTGVFGYFDGLNVDSAVMIRFIEERDNGYFYKSGGGITIYSDPETEYQELIDKVYVPFNRVY